MTFLDSEKNKAIRWFRNFADLLESGEAELLPASLSREDYGEELRLSGIIRPTRKSPKKVMSSNKAISKEVKSVPTPVEPERVSSGEVYGGRMSPGQAQQCYDPEKRCYTCPKCKRFTTNSETGLKKHANRCKG